MIRDDLTIAILNPKDGEPNWHWDFAKAFIPFFRDKLNAKHILLRDSVDHALGTCETKYLVVQSANHIIYDEQSVARLERYCDNMVVGYASKTVEYARLEETCLFFNIDEWKACDSPKFNGTQMIGVGFKEVSDGLERNGENAMVSKDDAARGGLLINAQLKKYGRFYNLPLEEGTFLFEFKTPYHELHFESIFEKEVLAKLQHVVMHESGEELPDLPDGVADVLITHAAGLSPLILAEHYKVKKIYVVDRSQEALDFQHLLFSAESSVLYGDVVSTFKDLPSAEKAVMVGDFDCDEYAVVQPLKDVEVIYKQVDFLSYELEDFIKEILDIESSVVVNFADIYASPLNYYKRRLEVGEGFFREIWSLLASRQGPTRLIGCNAFGEWVKGEIINGDITRFTL
jgi:hypothetical protein